MRDGLPQSQANAVFQDSRGFVWIITKNGLSRFDGIEFVNYYRQNGLPSNNVFQVNEDGNGEIWVLAAEGLSKYTGTGFRFFQPGNGIEKVDYFSHMAPTEFSEKLYLIGHSWNYTHARLYQFNTGTYSDYAAGFPDLDTLRFANIVYDTTRSDLVISDIYGNHFSWKDEKLTKLQISGVYDLVHERGEVKFRDYKTILNYADGKISPYSFGKTPGKAEAKLIVTPEGTRIKYFDG